MHLDEAEGLVRQEGTTRRPFILGGTVTGATAENAESHSSKTSSIHTHQGQGPSGHQSSRKGFPDPSERLTT